MGFYFGGGWCANCRNLRERQNTHHPQFCTHDVDHRFCGGGEWISRSDTLGLMEMVGDGPNTTTTNFEWMQLFAYNWKLPAYNCAFFTYNCVLQFERFLGVFQRWKPYRDANWWCIYYFLPKGGQTFVKDCDRNGRRTAILFIDIGLRGRCDSPTSFLTIKVPFTYSGKVHLISASTNCKQRSSTVSTKLPTVCKQASPLLSSSDLWPILLRAYFVLIILRN